LSSPWSIAIYDNNVFVVEINNHRVSVFSVEGTFLYFLLIPDKAWVSSMTFGTHGEMYLSVLNEQYMFEMSSKGTVKINNLAGKEGRVSAIAINPFDNHLYVACTQKPGENGLVNFSQIREFM
jgi:hypothetical protein